MLSLIIIYSPGIALSAVQLHKRRRDKNPVPSS